MSQDESPRRLPRILELRDPHPRNPFRVQQVDLEFSNGALRTYTRIRARGFGGVMIVAMPDEEHVLLIREYAGGVHRYELALPKGRVEEGENRLEGANRELQEECGFAARSLVEVGAFTLAPGFMNHQTHVVLARDLYPSRLEGDEPEPLEVVRWPLADLLSLAERDDCTEGRSIAALYLVRDLLATGRLDPVG